MQTNTAKTYSRPKQAAMAFNISIMTLRSWSKLEGFPKPSKLEGLPKPSKCGQITLYDIAAIEQWLAARAEL